MKFLEQGQMKGFMVNLMSYNIELLNSNQDNHAILEQLKEKIKNKLT